MHLQCGSAAVHRLSGSIFIYFTNRTEERKMKNYTDGDYALNKYSAGIVYSFVGGTIYTVTLSAYLEENPGNTEEDFRALKAMSDDIYFQVDRAWNAESKRNISLSEAGATRNRYAPSPEDILIDAIDAQEKLKECEQRLKILKRALGELTDAQRRRFLMCSVKRISSHKIADLEGKNHKTILESINAAEKKIKKIISNS
jgi:hypothetical protein